MSGTFAPALERVSTCPMFIDHHAQARSAKLDRSDCTNRANVNSVLSRSFAGIFGLGVGLFYAESGQFPSGGLFAFCVVEEFRERLEKFLCRKGLR